LAACRAALIATLLPDPATPQERRELCEKIGGKVVRKIERRKMPNDQTVECEKEITEGGILHWKRETENAQDLEWFRQEIRKAYGGRAPKILDPFAGGGAIPLEAMRLGCEASAMDINPVAWFILKCTLEYPQRLAGKAYPLPDFILKNEGFMEAFYKVNPVASRTAAWRGVFKHLARPPKRKEELQTDAFQEHDADAWPPRTDLAWHVRAWSQWVFDHARRELAKFYPAYADFEPLSRHNPKSYEKVPMRLVSLRDDGAPDVEALNTAFSAEYLAGKRNPRWVAKPAVAYLWARTVKCKNCRASVPLLKTRWLCKTKDGKKRVVLTMEPNTERNGVVFDVETAVPVQGINVAQRREHDKRIGTGTMSRSGAKCPCCGAIMTMEDIRIEGRAGHLGAAMTAVVVAGQSGKEYRLPTMQEIQRAEDAEKALRSLFSDIPFGLPEEPLPKKEALGFRVPLYGFDQWKKLFTHRQLLALGTFVKWTREAGSAIRTSHDDMFCEAVMAYLACIVDKVADYNSNLVNWQPAGQKGGNTFVRWALPVKWDFAENNPIDSDSGGWLAVTDWVSKAVGGSLLEATGAAPSPQVSCGSATGVSGNVDIVVTDPPYYDAIPYSDLMDFFYVWLRRVLHGISPAMDRMFSAPLGPKWNSDTNDGELIDDASRHHGDKLKSKAIYEEGMFRAFQSCYSIIRDDGRLVVVFAHKQPDAWETLAQGIIRAGFVVNGSWPIQTEMGNRTRAMSSAALASSVWLVCKKRPATAKPGWDNHVLEEMRRNIRGRLRDFWDAGIRGPDFVWAATGPALEAFSKHPVVRMTNDPGRVMPISDIELPDGRKITGFLTNVRRMVVDFVVGRVLSGNGFVIGGEEADAGGRDRLDEPTAYYLLHRHDFGMDEAPAGACILYAISCGLSDKELSDTWNLIGFTKGKSGGEDEGELEADTDAEADPDTREDSGSMVKLKTWVQRKSRSLGFEAPGGKPVPLIDRVHCLMHLWKAGDVHKVDEYLDENGLRRQELFKRLLQSLIELSPHGSEERSLLESLSNHVGARGVRADSGQEKIADEEGKWTELEKGERTGD
jgi:adenine-specific DNA methylase